MSPASGRTAAPSHFGPPTAPSSTASATRQAASVSAGSGSPASSIAAPPKACSSTASSSGSTASTRTATAITSGPIPSPGRQTIRLGAMQLSTRQVEHVAVEVREAGPGQRARILGGEQREHLALTPEVAERDAVRELVVVQPPDDLDPAVDRRDQLAVERGDLLAELRDDRVGHAHPGGVLWGHVRVSDTSNKSATSPAPPLERPSQREPGRPFRTCPGVRHLQQDCDGRLKP